MMTIGELIRELEKYNVKSFCFRIKNGHYEAMVINRDDDVFGLGGDTPEEAAFSLLSALKTKKLIGSDGWEEMLNPNLN